MEKQVRNMLQIDCGWFCFAYGTVASSYISLFLERGFIPQQWTFFQIFIIIMSGLPSIFAIHLNINTKLRENFSVGRLQIRNKLFCIRLR